MFKPGDVVSYLEMCQEEGINLQRGMNFKVKGGQSIFLMSLRKGAPYADKIHDDGKILIYEGHDIPKYENITNPKRLDQPIKTPGGSLTQNGLFYKSAQDYKNGKMSPEIVRVYEKINAGIWVYNGVFKLIDAWLEESGGRKVFKFKLSICDDYSEEIYNKKEIDIEHNRMIPTHVKLEVWKRDKGKCVKCGSKDNLHFDHILPYSKGGSSLLAKNIQLLCARHNLAKSDKIE